MDMDLFPKLPDFQPIKILGRGATANVYLALHVPSGLPVAIKYVKKVTADLTNKVSPLIPIAISFKNPYIVSVFDFMTIDDSYVLITEYAEKGTLLDSVRPGDIISESSARKFFYEILHGLVYLHEEKKIIHRDIKMENILLDRNGHALITDFGLIHLSQTLHPDSQNPCGTPPYTPPEMIFRQEQTFKGDVWSAGVVLYTLVTGRMPFVGDSITSFFNSIILTEPDFDLPHLSNKLIDFLKHLLDKNPETRYSAKQALRHSWMKLYTSTLSNPREAEIIHFDGIPLENIVSLCPSEKGKKILGQKNATETITFRIAAAEAVKKLIMRHFGAFQLIPTQQKLPPLNQIPKQKSSGTLLNTKDERLTAPANEKTSMTRIQIKKSSKLLAMRNLSPPKSMF